jgi:hypothetical protein
VRTGFGTPPPASIRPAELNRSLALYGTLHPAPSVRLQGRQPDVTHLLRLTGGMAHYDWGINGQVLGWRTVSTGPPQPHGLTVGRSG